MIFKLFPLLFITLFPVALYAAEITVTSDRDPVALDESFTLTFESQEGVDGDPDFTPLERDFDIRSRSQSNSIQWVNGRKRAQQSWTLSVMARRSGELTIPPIRFGDDISTPIKISVIDSEQSSTNGQTAGTTTLEPIFLEVSTDRASVYLQAQLLYTVRFYTAIRIMDYSMSEPTYATGSAIIKKLGEDRQFETMRGGRRYVAVERRYAIFPQSSGELEIAPITFEGQIVSGRQSALQFFNQQMRIKRLRSETVSVKVKPVPASFTGTEWFPASQVTFNSEWLSQEFRVGEPVTRQLKIEAVGVDSRQIPSPTKGLKVSGIKSYPDQPQLTDSIGSSGVVGERLESIAMIPTRAGRLVLPELKLIWWDVDANRQREETIPQMVIDVLPATDVASLLPPLQQQGKYPGVAEIQNQAGLVKGGVSVYWVWITALLAAGWAITALLWWLYTQRLSTASAVAASKRSEKATSRSKLEKRIKKACQADDARGLEKALLKWAEEIWERDAPGNLTEMAAKVDSDFAEQLEGLNRAIYASDGGQWQSDLWRMAEGFRLKKGVTEGEGSEALSDLYPG